MLYADLHTECTCTYNVPALPKHFCAFTFTHLRFTWHFALVYFPRWPQHWLDWMRKNMRVAFGLMCFNQTRAHTHTWENPLTHLLDNNFGEKSTVSINIWLIGYDRCDIHRSNADRNVRGKTKKNRDERYDQFGSAEIFRAIHKMCWHIRSWIFFIYLHQLNTDG